MIISSIHFFLVYLVLNVSWNSFQPARNHPKYKQVLLMDGWMNRYHTIKIVSQAYSIPNLGCRIFIFILHYVL